MGSLSQVAERQAEDDPQSSREPGRSWGYEL